MIIHLEPYLTIFLIVSGGSSLVFASVILLANNKRVVHLIPPFLILFVMFVVALFIFGVWGEQGFLIIF